ncbi:MAG TPA: FeoA family protein [Pirellulales bacterium]|nr:FeoA family protein [Pirellulales bacterium]
MNEAIYDLVPLAQLSAGATAIVAAVLGCSDHIHRLHEMGLRSGAPIEMVQPGSPCILRLGSQKLGFRADELLSVLVKPSTLVSPGAAA